MTSILSEESVLCKKIIPLTLPDILRLHIINCHLAFKSADCEFVSVVGSVMFPPPLTKDAQVLIPEPVNRLPYVEREISQMWWNEQSPSEKITLGYMDGFNVVTMVLTRGSWGGQCQRSWCNDGRRGQTVKEHWACHGAGFVEAGRGQELRNTGRLWSWKELGNRWSPKASRRRQSCRHFDFSLK